VSEIQAATGKAAALTPDICVIGAGAAGLAIATAAAAFGVSVVLIERGAMGGARLDLRKAALLAAASRAQAMREAGQFGLSAGEPQVNYAQLHDHVQRASAALAANDSAERMGALGVIVIKGEGRFISRSTVKVGEQAIKARRFVIATGSRPALPSIAGLDAFPVLTPETLLDLTRRPDRLLVLGGDRSGAEFAQAMARLGSMVTLVEPGSLLADEDHEAAGLVRRALLRDGVALHETATVTRSEAARGGVKLVLADPGTGETVLEGTHLLVAAGRMPDIGGLDLDMAGVTSNSRGVIVNRSLRTQNRRVFAIGDCADAGAGTRIGQSASHQAGLVLRTMLFRLPARLDTHTVPRLTCCDPELASVGLTETQARADGGALTILRWPYAEIERAQAERETGGFVKLVSDRKGKILGATIIGARAGDLIAPWCLAVQKNFTVKDMAALVVPSPSFSEVSTRAAMSLYAPLAAKPGIRRLIGFLRRFG
jgi:pyruvate/2-oxoglutarate dehydrogenase complex dihydrolipoamide dehydrogenase (E3) component